MLTRLLTASDLVPAEASDPWESFILGPGPQATLQILHVQAELRAAAFVSISELWLDF